MSAGYRIREVLGIIVVGEQVYICCRAVGDAVLAQCASSGEDEARVSTRIEGDVGDRALKIGAVIRLG